MIIRLAVNCVNCDEEIVRESLHLAEDETDITVNISEFEQSSWRCPECGHTTCIGDIYTEDAEDL